MWGVGSSPFIATHCIRQVAAENRTRASPLTVNALTKNMYVDNLLKSLDTIEQAKTVYHESTELFTDFGFKINQVVC